MTTKILTLVFSAVSLLGLTACQPQPHANQHNHPNLVSGKQLFNYHCATCHQIHGQGNYIKGIPANRNTPLSIEAIVYKLQHGEPQSKMPVFIGMSEEEATLIANYLIQLKQTYPNLNNLSSK